MSIERGWGWGRGLESGARRGQLERRDSKPGLAGNEWWVGGASEAVVPAKSSACEYAGPSFGFGLKPHPKQSKATMEQLFSCAPAGARL